MARKMFVLTMLSFLLGIGGVWALHAQDPAQQKPTTTTTTTEPQTPTRQTTTTQATQMDLSGTYAGTFRCEPAGLMGDTTLTINGNEFTTSDGRTGRITTSRSKGYTAVALQVNGTDPNTPSSIISLRAKKSGKKLTLTPVAGSTKQCTFTPSKATARNRATQTMTPAATGTEVSNPTTTTPVPAQTPSPSPSPSPEASPTPSGSPRPRPRPSPGASPSPSPTEPMPSPTPSPSPSPRP